MPGGNDYVSSFITSKYEKFRSLEAEKKQSQFKSFDFVTAAGHIAQRPDSLILVAFTQLVPGYVNATEVEACANWKFSYTSIR